MGITSLLLKEEVPGVVEFFREVVFLDSETGQTLLLRVSKVDQNFFESGNIFLK